MTSPNQGISRRDFLTTAAAASLPVLLPRVATGDDKKTAANERLALGFIGIGTQMRGHLNFFLGQKDTQVVAVCDVDTTRREAGKQQVEQRYAQEQKSGQYKGCAASNDFREIVNRKDIDAVVIATPDHWHALSSTGSLQGGQGRLLREAVDLDHSRRQSAHRSRPET